MTNNSDIIPTHLVIRAMRDNGYKNAAFALAELMDNSIQAGASNVELLCSEQVERLKQRSRPRISEIAVLDNGGGMSADVLQMALQFGNGTRLADYSGIGRFGMGLPNSSISQARRVDVWSWQDGPEKANHTYIDIDEIEDGRLNQVPTPNHKSIPKLWLEVGNTFDKSGTLVVWSSLDRILWRTARAIIDNSELLIGRMYRYFLANDDVRIRLASFDKDATKELRAIDERYALANDPLYLLADTSCPDPWNKNPMFTQGDFQNTEFDILFNGEKHTVTVRFSYAKDEAREAVDGRVAGTLEHGKHARRNVGLSIVRARRELDLDASWSDPHEVRDRWWGAEISFPPALDDLFGVTNNKQSARNFSELAKTDLESLLEEDQTLGSSKEEFDAEKDPRLPLLEIAAHIKKNINVMRRLIHAQRAMTKQQRHKGHQHSEKKGTDVTRRRIEEGFEGASDKQEAEQPPEKRKLEIIDELLQQGTTQKQAEELAAQTVGRGLKYTLIKADLNSPAFFDVKSRGGAIIISLNISHPAYNHLVELLQSEVDDIDEQELRSRLITARDGIELLLMAWARYEDEQPDGPRRVRAQEARWDWGRMARDFLVDEDDS